jgi:hypothetical protein
VNLDGAQEVFARGRFFNRDFNPGDRFSSEGEGLDGRIERAYYRVDVARLMSAYRGTEARGNLIVKAGRDLVLWGNGLTLSQELDGAVIDLSYERLNLELIAGVTPKDTVDFDTSRPRFESDTHHGFYGALFSMYTADGKHRPFVYILDQRDYNHADTGTEELGGATLTTNFDYNSHYIGIGSTGAITDRLSYGIEAVYEGGQTLSNSFSTPDNTVQPETQTLDPIEAYAVDFVLDYVLPDRHITRLSAELIAATGDSDRLTTSNTFGGNKPRSKDRAFNAYGLLNTGVAFSPSVSNLLVFRLGASSFPLSDYRIFRRMQLGTDLFAFEKLNADAPIDEPTTNDRFLGGEADVYLNYQITSDLTFTTRYGAFVPGDAIVNDGKIRQFFYAGLTIAF